jgi:cytoskeletal protein CcmA (bactofilin family)
MSIWKNLRGDGEKDERPAEELASTLPATLAPTAPSEPRRRRREEQQVANIGKSITIKGDVTGQEDLVIEGRVEGRIELASHHLTIGPNGEIEAEISAKQVTIIGRVVGNVTAAERVEVCDTGRLEGDLVAPRLLIQEGAVINGAISMKKSEAKPSTPPRPESAPRPQNAPRLEDVSKTAS